jgi:transposase InsO family protein
MTTNPETIPLPGTTPQTRTTPKHDIHKFRTVTHLTDDNWVQHKFEQIAALEERGLYNVVLGKEEKPDEELDPEAFKLWKDKDVSAKAQIIQNLSREVQPIVFNCNTSKEVWQALRDEYESSNLDKIANVRYLYDTLAYVEGSGMRNHINRLMILREQLGAMGDKIPDTSHAMRLIRLLPPSWEGLCVVLRGSMPTVARVKASLLAEEESRKTVLSYAYAGSATALLSALPNPQSLPTPPTAALHATPDPQLMANLQALITTQFGSLLLNSAKPNDQSRRKSNLKNPHLKCDNCKKKGHTKDRCWAKGGGQEGKGPKSKRGDDSTSNADPSLAEANLADFEWSGARALVAEIACGEKPRTNEWILDSGATTHIVPFRSIFSSYHKFQSPRPIGTADHGSFQAVGIGNVWIKLDNGNARTSLLELRNVLHAPRCSANITSVNGLTKCGNTLTFAGNSCSVLDPNGSPIIQVSKQRGQLYRLQAQPFENLKMVPQGHQAPTTFPRNSANAPVMAMHASQQMNDLLMWHCRLNHLNWDALRAMRSRGLVKGLEKAVFPKDNPRCDHCAFGKMSVKPFLAQEGTQYTRPLQLVSTDICGPFSPSIGGKRYLMVFVDAYTRFVFPYYIKDRKDAPNCLREFIAYAKRQAGHKLLAIRSDNAKELIFGEFSRILKEHGIKHQTTAPYSSASNGRGERVFRTIQENGLASLHASPLKEIGFWPEAMDYTIHTRNRVLHSGINDVPYKRWSDTLPSVSNTHPFGCRVKYLMHPAIRRKGDFHARSGFFLGYYDDSPAYKIWNPKTCQFVKTRSVIFEDSPMQVPSAPYNALDVDDDTPTPMDFSPSPSPARDNPPSRVPNIMTRPLSPLSDIEEVDGSSPSVLDRNVRQPQQVQLDNVPPFETDRLGYKIRPEQNPNHPDFASYGRSGGRSQRARKPVERAYTSEFADLFGRMKKARDGGRIEEMYESMDALITHYDTFEKSQLEGNPVDEEDYAALLAGFNVKSRTVTHREVFAFPNGFRKNEAIKAIKAEIQQIERKKVWERVAKPEHMQTFLDIQFIVTEKFDAYGKYIKTKARAVVRGDKQEEGKDYDETHTHTPSMGLFRFTLALINALGLNPRQLDVVGAFLEAPLHMDVFVRTPPMVNCPDGMVLKLQRALYGMKQAPREFGEHRDRQLRSIGYRHTSVAPSLFFRFTEDSTAKYGIYTDLGLWWVDDDLGAFEEREDGK